MTTGLALSAAPRSRVPANIDYDKRTRLTGHIHPNATAENDIGTLDTAEVLSGVTITLKPTAEQEAELDRLLAERRLQTLPTITNGSRPKSSESASV